jgi:hypothetical protein
MTVSIRDHMITWTPADWQDDPTRGGARVVKHPDTSGRGSRYKYSAGACWGEVREWNKKDRTILVLSDALAMILRDGLDPAEVHRALWVLEGYRFGLPDDVAPPNDGGAA